MCDEEGQGLSSFLSGGILSGGKANPPEQSVGGGEFRGGGARNHTPRFPNEAELLGAHVKSHKWVGSLPA